MSIVPYTNNKIVLHDPSHGLLVLHNKQDNSIELVNTERDEGTSGPNQPRVPDLLCPNCGYSWDSGRRPSAGRLDSTLQTKKAFLGHRSLGSPPVTTAFMDHDYFKLLEKLPFKTKPIGDDDPLLSLPQHIFNQGYFQRFFRQQPPYKLGLGAHAQVYKVTHVLNDIVLGTYAVKRISMGNQLKYLQEVLNEVLILYELSVQGAYEHNLIRYNHVWLEMGDIDDLSTYFLGPDSKKVSGSKVPYVFILQQYCDGGHLETLIRRNFQQELEMTAKQRVEKERLRRRSARSGVPKESAGRSWLTELEVWKFLHDISTAVNYLHHHNILHRDLKPSNCLLDTQYTANTHLAPVLLTEEEFTSYCEALPKVLVSDFGEGKFINKQSLRREELRLQDEERRGNTGTLEFTAPELWAFTNYDPETTEAHGEIEAAAIHTFESDIYSLGLILCWMCVGTLPFSHLIQGETDPQVIRSSILKWYYACTYGSFVEWFGDHCKLETSGCLTDFGRLVYAMIKGNEDTKTRMTSADVLKYLSAMKREWFLTPAAGESEDFSEDDQLHELAINAHLGSRQGKVESIGLALYIVEILFLQAITIVRPHMVAQVSTIAVVMLMSTEIALGDRLALKKLSRGLALLLVVLVPLRLLVHNWIH